MSRRLVSGFALGCACLAACGEDPTAIDYELVSDPNVSTTAQLVEAIDSIVMVFDSPDGLYAPEDARSDGTVQIKNADADESDLELVALVQVPRGRLPRVRLERGGLPDVPIDVRVVGVIGTEDGPQVARGGVRGSRFVEGRITSVSVPFNILPELLPPRVVDVIPRDGDRISGCDVPAIVVMFSKPMDAASVTAPGRITFEPGGAPLEVTVDSSGLVAIVSPPAISGGGGEGSTLSYRMTIAAEVEDRDGIALDQLPAEVGAQRYEGEFVLTCGPGMATPDDACGAGLPGTGLCPGAGRLVCMDGACVLGSCTNAACAAGFVCDETTFACVADCRTYAGETCPAARPTCEESSGVCR